MSTISRKQREVREREEMILDVSRKMLVEQGFAGFSMDRLADSVEYSKGVVYQHFKSKEDLVAALAVQSLRQRVERFQKAAAWTGRPRERMLAVGVAEELFVRLHPHHFQSEQIIKMASLHERASQDRLDELRRQEASCFSTVLGIVNTGVESGDLALPSHTHAAEVVMALWTLNFGFYTLLQVEGDMLAEQGITDPYTTLRRSCHALLDGFGWQPLSSEWDYQASYSRILSEVFPEEGSLIAANQLQTS